MGVTLVKARGYLLFRVGKDEPGSALLVGPGHGTRLGEPSLRPHSHLGTEVFTQCCSRSGEAGGTLNTRL